MNADESAYPHRLRRLYWPFLALAEVCRDVVGTVAGAFEVDAKRYTIPRFVFRGPSRGAIPVRVGLFALLHGNALAGTLGLERLLSLLVAEPVLAAGYELSFYPLCNPTGYEDDTAHNRAGRDLNREFWRGSTQPEVRILEEELRQQRFDGVVALHSGSTGGGEGSLSAPPGQQPGPFRFILEVPPAVPMTQQVEAISCALHGLLKEYWGFIAPRPA
jgi:protein MpaA